MELETRLARLRSQMLPIERFIHLFEASLSPPHLSQSSTLHRGFRYDAPDTRHFCLLKIVRAISAFNAAIELCRTGYTQELCVLLRTIVECTTHIDYVLAQDVQSDAARDFVDAYFSDLKRGEVDSFRRPALRQGALHDSIGAVLDEFIKGSDYSEKYRGVNTSKLYSRVYLVLSNYVHCKYPETMDLYGGLPGKFHVRGMSGTPKDDENIELLETYFTSVSQCAQLIILRLKLLTLLSSDSIVSRWMQSNL